MARKAKIERQETSEGLQKKALKFLVLKACVARLEKERDEVREEIKVLMGEEKVTAFDINFDGEVVGDVKPKSQRSFGMASRRRMAEIVSVRQLLELIKMDSKTYDALTKLFADDPKKLKILKECVSVTSSESMTISKKRGSDEMKYAKAAIEKAQQEAEDNVQQLFEALKEGEGEQLVEELLEDEEEAMV